MGSATLVAATATVPEYCRVLGFIRPVDQLAPPINFQVNLPAAWNNKAMQFGGGGTNGTVVSGLGNVPSAPTTSATPLARGYATFGSDSGHTATGNPLTEQTFGLNDESFANFAGDSLRKTLDVAQVLMSRTYGSAPTRQYIAGGSQGGSEVWNAILRWPDKYQGGIAYYPNLNQYPQGVALNILFKQMFVQTGNPPQPGWFNVAKQTLIRQRANAFCDPLDGVTDMLVANPNACEAQFPVETLRCPGGVDTGNTCLSDAQLNLLAILRARTTLPFALANGVATYPGYQVLGGGMDLSLLMGSTGGIESGFFGLGATSSTRFIITRDGTADPLTHNPSAFADRWIRASALKDGPQNTGNAFEARNKGVKMLWVHGTSDTVVRSGVSIDWWNRLNAAFGLTALRDWARFYLVPGFGHGGPAPSYGFNMTWDSLPVLEDWVERGVAPPLNGLTTSNGTGGRTLPLCDYPGRPQYRGSGDVNLAASYECVTP